MLSSSEIVHARNDILRYFRNATPYVVSNTFKRKKIILKKKQYRKNAGITTSINHSLPVASRGKETNTDTYYKRTKPGIRNNETSCLEHNAKADYNNMKTI